MKTKPKYIFVTGGVVSSTIRAVSGFDTFPTWSVAVTVTVIVPSVIAVRVVCQVVAVG